MGREWHAAYERAIEALQWGNPQPTDRLSLLMVGHSFALDIVAHCDTEEQARVLRAAIAKRLETLGLELHPEKTRIVYCKNANRRGSYEHTSFDFLGYTFRGRRARG